MMKCDLIMVIWNEWKMTKDALKTIKENSNFPYRLILVDNNSDLKTKDFLQSIEKSQEYGETTVIYNDKNEGWLKATNKGLKESRSPYMCLINNDILCGVDWLKNIIDLMEKNPQIGLVNPRGNEISENKKVDDVDIYSQELSMKNFEQYEELDHCSGFCMVIKRELTDKIGILDEVFGHGYYEDNDFSRRAQEEGYICAQCDYSFVLHFISRSFGKVPEWKAQLIAKNKKIFFDRWGSFNSSLVLSYKENSDFILKQARKGNKFYIIENKILKRDNFQVVHQNIKFLNFSIKCLLPLYFLYKSYYLHYKKRVKDSVIYFKD